MVPTSSFLSDAARPPTTVRRALILANFHKSAVQDLARDLRPWLQERVPEVALETDILRFCVERERPGAARGPRPDLLVVLGGDGALLGAVRAFADDPVPTLGINFGRVGFLASTPASRWQETLSCVLAGECPLEERMRICASFRSPAGDQRRAVSLNDVTLQRGSHQGMLVATLAVGDDLVTNYRADGLIVATPSGSTGYSLSAGGPILEPSLQAIVVTPICSQGLSNRPIVLHPSARLSLTVAASSGITTLAIDGQIYHSLQEGQTVAIERHPEPYPLYALPGLDPYRRLRDRLGWRGSVEPDQPTPEP
jgi:NAD+ kinase